MADKKSVQFVEPSSSVEEVVIVPKKAKNVPKTTKVNDPVDDRVTPPLRRSQSDGEMYLRGSNLTAASSITARTNWMHLVDHMKKKAKIRRTAHELSFIDAVKKSKAERKKGKCARCRIFARKLSCLFLGPMFYRHRFRFIIFLEVFAPVLIFLFISWAFTSGVSWKKAYSERKATNDLLAKRSGRDFSTVPTDEKLLLQKFNEKFVNGGRVYMAFEPFNEFTSEIMDSTLKILGFDPQTVRVIYGNPHSAIGASGMDDEYEVLEHSLLHRLDQKTHKSPVGIEFTLGDIDPITKLPHTFKFVIRTFDKTISETLTSHPYVQPPRKFGTWYPPYVESGFMGLQIAIQRAYITKIHATLCAKLDKKIENSNSSFLDRMPLYEQRIQIEDPAFPTPSFKLLFTPNYFDSNVRQLIAVTICLILCVSYTALSYFIVRQIVIENQSRIKDFLSLHNMAKYLHWIVYFFHSFVFRTITAIGITIILYIDYGNGPIFSQSNPVIVYIIIFLHLMSLSSFNFLIGTFLTSVTFSGIFSVSVCLFSFIFPYCLQKVKLLSETVNLILTLVFPNWALWNAIYEIVDYECDDVGVTWTNFKILTNEKVQLTYLQCIFIFIGGNIVYFCLAMIRDLGFTRAKNREFSWYGCCQKVLKRRHLRLPRLTRSSGVVSPAAPAQSQPDRVETPLVYEQPDSSRSVLARIRNLSKNFSQYKLALDNINLDIMTGEIMIILGHCDSGKSTLLQSLAGIVEPTFGTITIHDLDLFSKKSKAREYIGYCPQEIVLFNVLSVQEHLVLCYKLRGLSTKDAKEYATGLMELLRIVNVKKFTPGGLTHDEQRKLAIALCLVDRPSIILLDEPTNGMEPITRHEIWNILKSLKQEGHTIVMTSNMMDEAEFLADRVALLSHGKLICYGSPKFLQERYDVGYYLRIIPNPAKFSLESFQDFASKWFIEPLREAPEKTMFDQRNFLLVMPNQIKNFAEFFDALETSKDSLGVIAYGTQTVGLCDIFIKMSEAASVGKNAPDIYIRKTKTGAERSVFWGEIPTDYDESSKTTQRTQFKALFHKLWLFGSGGNMVLFWEIFFPCVIIWITVWHSHCFVNPPPAPIRREFLLSNFPQAKVFYREQGGVSASSRMDFKSTLAEYLGKQGEELKLNAILENVVQMDTDRDRLNLEYSIEKRMIAAEFRSASAASQGAQFLGYYSSGSLHSPPLILSVIGNVLVRTVTKKMNDTGVPYTIIVGNHPFPTVFESDFALTCGMTCIMFGLCVSVAIGVFISLLMTFPMLERVTGMKQLQFMSGCLPVTYWSSYYVFHFFVSLILSIGVTVIFAMDTQGMYVSAASFGTILTIVALFLCWSGIPWVYFLTTVVPMSKDGPIMGFIIHIIFAFIPILIVESAFSDSTEGFAVFLRYFFHLFPPYTLTNAVYIFFEIVAKRSTCTSLPAFMRQMCNVDMLHRDKERYTADMKQIFEYMVKHDTNLARCCDRICEPTDSCLTMTPFFSGSLERWGQPRLFVCVIAFLFQGLLYWALLMILESRAISDYCHNVILKFLKNRVTQDVTKLPPDLRAEKMAVDAIMKTEKCPEGTLLVCQDLAKTSIEQTVITDVNIQLKEGDIVGLLGGTGCGKSVVLKMLAGEIVPTRGTIILDNLNLHKNRNQFLRRMSYCHQDDAVFDSFTGIQMIELMGKLRGLPKAELSIHAKKWLHVLGLADAANDKCLTYSKSMRRRLCAAMTLIGGNPVLVLDEPTRGLDAIAKLRFWSVMRELASRGHGIIFTSANVPECERNATRLVVLSEGNVQCIGPPEQLRQRFSKGFTFLIRLRYDVLTPIEIVSTTVGRINDLKKTVEKFFKKAILRDEQGNLLLYFISTSGKVTLGGIFAAAEEIKKEHQDVVDHYLVSQSTLDDVFVLLTNRFKDMDIPRSMRGSYPGEMSQYEAEVEALDAATKLKSFD